MQIRCPHCRHPVEVVDEKLLDALICPSCGSNISLVSETATEEYLPAGARRLGHFQLLDRVGIGGYGTVWKAHDTVLDRTVALKVPRRGQLDASDVEYFLRDARAAAQLRHPNIVSVHEVGRDGDTVFIASDYIEGANLKEWLSARPMTVRETAEFVAQIADAVQHAHERGVVHRDLKPGNILIDQNGRPHVTDFGLAKRETGEITLTLDGQILGTPAYMSPEQARGKSHEASAASDIYSLGVILFELLTGELPFRGEKRMLILQILNDEPPSPRKLNGRIPRDLETICLRAMSKEPGGRYASARDMADDLRRFLKGEPILARPIGRAERVWRWCRRKPIVAGLSAGVALSLAAILVLLSLYAARERARALDLQHNLARQYLRRGQLLCEQGDLARGLHWIARGLKEAPQQSTSLQESIRENLAGWARHWVPPRAFLELDASLLQMALSPDGKRAVTSTYGGNVQFWSVETGELLNARKQHLTDITSIAFSPEGRRVVTASNDNTACLWDAETGDPVGVTLRHEAGVLAAAFSPDGKLVATGCSDKMARLWSSATGAPVGTPMQHDGFVEFLAFSIDGGRLLTASYGGAAKVWNVSTGASVGATIRHPVVFQDIALSPDGQTILTGSNDQTARLWNADSGLPIGAPMLHGQVVICVAFSPDGQHVLTGCADGTARLWDAKTAQPTDVVMRHQGDVLDVRFSADGKRILTGSWDGMARLWDADTGELLGLPLRHTHSARVPFVELAGHTVLTGSSGSLAVIWDAPASTSNSAARQRKQSGVTLAFSPDGRRILTADEFGRSAAWWSPKSGRSERSSLWHGTWLWAVTLSADGKHALVGGQEPNTAQLWSVRNEERLLFDLPHADQVRAVAFSLDGKFAATACFDRTARIWSADSGQQVGPPLVHASMVEDVSFSPDGALVVTACGDGAARMWSVKTGHQVGPELRHRESVLAAIFSPDGKLVATGGRDNTASFWDVATGQSVGTALEQRDWVEDVCFSPDGKQLATASSDGSVRIWSVETREMLGPAFDFGGWAHEVTFHPDGTSLAAAGHSPGGARWWNLPPPSNIGVEDAELHIQVLTWTEMDENGVLGRLDRKTWQARRAQLDSLANQ